MWGSRLIWDPGAGKRGSRQEEAKLWERSLKTELSSHCVSQSCSRHWTHTTHFLLAAALPGRCGPQSTDKGAHLQGKRGCL